VPPDTDDRASILVIAAWWENEHLRARITSTRGARLSGRDTVVVADRAALLEVVERWIDLVERGVRLD
jgi:hypothetical protein